MTKRNIHSASPSFLGFLFQIERVLLWLSEGNIEKVGIETDDDIVVQLNNNYDIKIIYEQAKNTLTTNVPFSDQSEDLWKTLHIWLCAIESGNIDPSKAVFSAVTNKKLPANRLIMKLSSASKNDEVNMKNIMTELRTVAYKLSKKKKIYGETIINSSDETLMILLDRITVMDGTVHHNTNDFKKKLKANLSMSEKLPFDYIYQGLFGHIVDVIIDCWKQKKEAWLHVQDFNTLYNNLVSTYSNKTFIEKNTELLPISKNELNKNRKNLYVEQLKVIKCGEDEILEAIHDFLRSKSEKNRYAREFEITESAYSTYYDDLKQYWKATSRPRFKNNPLNRTPEEIGYEVFYEAVKYKGKLNNQEPEQSYTYIGAYHHLANETQLGWHPSWENLFKTQNKENDK